MKKLLALAALVVCGSASIACFIPGAGCGGVPGNNDQLIFGSAVNYQGVDAMSAPAAAGSKLLVAIEGSHGSSAVESALAVAHIALRVERVERVGSDGRTVEPTTPGAPSVVTEMGLGHWSVTVPTVGGYRLVATNEAGSVVDTFDLRAVAPDALAIDDAVTVVTHGTSPAGAPCEVRSTASLRTLVLRANQEAQLVTVATAGTTRLAGVLDLATTAPRAGVTLRAVEATATTPANANAVSMDGTTEGPIEFEVSERGTTRRASARIATAAGNAPVVCAEPEAPVAPVAPVSE